MLLTSFILMNDVPLSIVTSCRDFGSTVSINLSFSEHIKNIVALVLCTCPNTSVLYNQSGEHFLFVYNYVCVLVCRIIT